MNEMQKEQSKMMGLALSLLPVQQQTAICMAVLNSVASANATNPAVTNCGYVPSDDPIDNLISFLQAMKAATEDTPPPAVMQA